MSELSSIVNAATRTVFLLMSAALFAWAFLPEHRPLMAGLALGLVAGLLTVRNLAMKVMRLSEMAANQEKGRVNFGLLTRMCISLLVVMIAVKFEQISLMSTIIGLFFSQLIILVVAISVASKNK
ncbi:ATP synthase subunit I [Paenibacillus arenosi]|uniref:ATP synthase subunit I n=1 Tax=Paenibacillus arenosi TaxID=2774142 RepID=A0ABR9AVN4_9BACL|nr:ATP synthase subunit I [Paenibacillus arenosi]MBD8498197.1 ATP synthase subunit I [Paenibacillus arenosi]